MHIGTIVLSFTVVCFVWTAFITVKYFHYAELNVTYYYIT